jgi:hypothetical protein
LPRDPYDRYVGVLEQDNEYPRKGISMTDSHKLDWERVWFPSGTTLPYLSGFLPELPAEVVPNPQGGVPLSSLEDVPCLILLGLPGMGKTNEMQRQARAALEAMRLRSFRLDVWRHRPI